MSAEAKVCPNCGADVSKVWPPPPEGRQPPEPARDDPALVRAEVNNGATSGCVWQVVISVAMIMIVLSLTMGSKFMAAIGKLIPPGLFGAALQGSFYLPAVAVMFAVYLALRPRRPYYARGVGYSVIFGLALSLGLIAICGR